MAIVDSLLKDPSKYVTLSFMVFVLNWLLEAGKDKEAERILLDHRISVTLYPNDLWSLYITKMCSTSRP